MQRSLRFYRFGNGALLALNNRVRLFKCSAATSTWKNGIAGFYIAKYVAVLRFGLQ
jgi:hypothetical protein